LHYRSGREEGTHVVNEQVGRLHGREVAAAVELRPVRDQVVQVGLRDATWNGRTAVSE
jgi:hypothetical protein